MHVGGGLIFVWRVRRFSVWGLTLEGLLKARLLCHDHVRFQRMSPYFKLTMEDLVRGNVMRHTRTHVGNVSSWGALVKFESELPP